jgi:hypothetical protein
LELKKRKENLKFTKETYADWLIFKANWWTSAFGTNWILPFAYVFVISAIIYFLLYFFVLKNPTFEWLELFRYISM